MKTRHLIVPAAVLILLVGGSGCASGPGPRIPPDAAPPSFRALSAAAASAPIPPELSPGGCSCGCQAGHCGAGIPAHLACGSRTPEEKKVVERRIADTKDAIAKGFKDAAKTTDCNVLVHSIAVAYGYRGFTRNDGTAMKADEMWTHLLGSIPKTEDDIKRNQKTVLARSAEGWRFLSPDATERNPKMITLREAMQFANAGYLVVGLMQSEIRRAVWETLPIRINPNTGAQERYNPKSGNAVAMPRAGTGHTFALNPDQKPSDEWGDCTVANAGSGSGEAKAAIRLSEAVSTHEAPSVLFAVYQQPRQ